VDSILNLINYKVLFSAVLAVAGVALVCGEKFKRDQGFIELIKVQNDK
jgi:uncharacterized membrane protein